MAAVLAAAIYSRIGFSIYFAVRARCVRVPGESKFHLEPGTILVILQIFKYMQCLVQMPDMWGR